MWDEGDEPDFICATPEEAATIPEVKYEYLDHPADVQIHAWGGSLQEAYEQVAMGMFGYMTEDPKTVEIKEVREVEAEAEDLQGLLFHFLDECLFQFCCEPFFIARKVVITEWVAGGLNVAAGKEVEGKGEGGGKEGSAGDESKGKEDKEEEGKEGRSGDGKGEENKEGREAKGGTGDAGGKEKGKESGVQGDSSKAKEEEMEVEECESDDSKKRGGERGEEAKKGETGKVKEEDMEVTERGSSDDKHATDTEREQGGFGGTGGEATSGHEGSGAGTLRIRARLYGEEFDLDKHPQGTEVKAITYASMQVYDKPGQHEVFVIVDI